jgi:hypothetical protein
MGTTSVLQLRHDKTLQHLPQNAQHSYGFMTWEWTVGIRGFLHPLVFAAVMKTLSWLGLDSVTAVVSTKIRQRAFYRLDFQFDRNGA